MCFSVLNVNQFKYSEKHWQEWMEEDRGEAKSAVSKNSRSRWVIKPFMNICIVIMSCLLLHLIKARNLSVSLWWNFYHDSLLASFYDKNLLCRYIERVLIEHETKSKTRKQSPWHFSNWSSFERHRRRAARSRFFRRFSCLSLVGRLSRSHFEVENQKLVRPKTNQSSKLSFSFA